MSFNRSFYNTLRSFVRYYTYYDNSLVEGSELKHPWAGLSEKQILDECIILNVSYTKSSNKVDHNKAIYLKDLPSTIKSLYNLDGLDDNTVRKFINSTMNKILGNLILGRLDRLDLIEERTVELIYMFEEFELQENTFGYHSDVECLSISIKPLLVKNKPGSKSDNILRSYMSGLVIYEKEQQIIFRLPDTKNPERYLVEISYNREEITALIADIMEAVNISIHELSRELEH